MQERVEILVPDPESLDDARLKMRLAALAAAASPSPFGIETRAFCRRLAMLLTTDAQARRSPEIQAFAFWMRPTAVERFRRHHQALSSNETVMAGKGLIVHLPPGNVAMLFAYCWLLALLAGNRNIVRLSRQRPGPVDILLRLIGRALDESPGLRPGQLFLSYGHDDRVTARLSEICDMRVIWGGDETVRHIRGIALPSCATELTFGDRFSMAALNAEAVLALTEEACTGLAEALYNDVFQFDQMACSSPRLLVWTGEEGHCATAGGRLYEALGATIIRKGYAIDAGGLSSKLSYAYRGLLDGPVSRLRFFGGGLAVLTLKQFFDFREDIFGAGTLFELRLADLTALARFVRRKDQTLGHFGFAAEELSQLAGRLNGRGFDRMVPVGRALAFDHVWDGHDLLSAFSRPVAVICST